MYVSEEDFKKGGEGTERGVFGEDMVLRRPYQLQHRINKLEQVLLMGRLVIRDKVLHEAG